MTTSVLVIGGGTTLTVTLSLRTGWQVVTTPDGAPPEVVVVVDDGIRPLREQIGFDVDAERVIVVSSVMPTEAARTWLTPPYPLEELVAAVEQVLSRDPDPAAAHPAGMESPTRIDLEAPADVVTTGAGMSTGIGSQVRDDQDGPPAAPLTATPVAVVDDAAVDVGAPAGTSVTAPGDHPTHTVELTASRAAADDLSRLLERMPVLRAPGEVVDLLAEEVAEALGAAAVGFWRVDEVDDRYPCVGGTGLTVGERGTRLRPDHAVVRDALASDGMVIEHGLEDPARVAGLPGVRHEVLLLIPLRGTPVGDLLGLVGMDVLRPEAFDAVDAIVAGAGDVLALSASLARLAEQLGDP